MSAGWVFLPVLGAPLAHAPVLRWDLAPGLRRPINARLFGANKTWRGAATMTAGAIAAAVALHGLPAYRRRLPTEVADAGPVTVGALLGISAWAGELPNSFVKRRLGIPPGGHRRTPAGIVISAVDQVDWVPTAWLLLSPVWKLSLRDGLQVTGLALAIHLPINVIGYLVGARTTPI